MDFDSSFPTAPTRYAFDDSDDENLQQDTQGQQSVILKYAPSSSARKTLVIGVTGAGSVLLNALNGERKVVGEVALSGGDAKPSAFPILEFASTNFLLLPCNEAVSTEQAFSWTKAALEGITNLERVIVLDTFTAAGYITAATREDDLQPPCLRVLNTSAASPVQNLIIYEPPNLAKGLSAAILNHVDGDPLDTSLPHSQPPGIIIRQDAHHGRNFGGVRGWVEDPRAGRLRGIRRGAATGEEVG
ncbi:hypothetical protein BC938DRAFT_475856 [Jimgerdemannia flammicorona]|uniref:Uncharacterized protein n=1 Tax=Jimgerdemannia flammicorona TaxID=994334 RepID=A0A433PN30_9FUNG|nr:hypothetical protein BC938DRAFT_475856 [Jimgerdemannia flammicorona]